MANNSGTESEGCGCILFLIFWLIIFKVFDAIIASVMLIVSGLFIGLALSWQPIVFLIIGYIVKENIQNRKELWHQVSTKFLVNCLYGIWGVLIFSLVVNSVGWAFEPEFIETIENKAVLLHTKLDAWMKQPLLAYAILILLGLWVSRLSDNLRAVTALSRARQFASALNVSLVAATSFTLLSAPTVYRWSDATDQKLQRQYEVAVAREKRAAGAIYIQNSFQAYLSNHRTPSSLPPHLFRALYTKHPLNVYPISYKAARSDAKGLVESGALFNGPVVASLSSSPATAQDPLYKNGSSEHSPEERAEAVETVKTEEEDAAEAEGEASEGKKALIETIRHIVGLSAPQGEGIIIEYVSDFLDHCVELTEPRIDDMFEQWKANREAGLHAAFWASMKGLVTTKVADERIKDVEEPSPPPPAVPPINPTGEKPETRFQSIRNGVRSFFGIESGEHPTGESGEHPTEEPEVRPRFRPLP